MTPKTWQRGSFALTRLKELELNAFFVVCFAEPVYLFELSYRYEGGPIFKRVSESELGSVPRGRLGI